MFQNYVLYFYAKFQKVYAITKKLQKQNLIPLTSSVVESELQTLTHPYIYYTVSTNTLTMTIFTHSRTHSIPHCHPLIVLFHRPTLFHTAHYYAFSLSRSAKPHPFLSTDALIQLPHFLYVAFFICLQFQLEFSILGTTLQSQNLHPWVDVSENFSPIQDSLTSNLLS